VLARASAGLSRESHLLARVPAQLGRESRFLVPASAGLGRESRVLVPASAGLARESRFLVPASAGLGRESRVLVPASAGLGLESHALTAEFAGLARESHVLGRASAGLVYQSHIRMSVSAGLARESRILVHASAGLGRGYRALVRVSAGRVHDSKTFTRASAGLVHESRKLARVSARVMRRTLASLGSTNELAHLPAHREPRRSASASSPRSCTRRYRPSGCGSAWMSSRCAGAVGVHGRPRATKDLDVWIEASPDNARRVLKALRDFGAPLGDLTDRDFETPGTSFKLGEAPARIDILTHIEGVRFEDAWPRRRPGRRQRDMGTPEWRIPARASPAPSGKRRAGMRGARLAVRDVTDSSRSGEVGWTPRDSVPGVPAESGVGGRLEVASS
jgi:hypothetical protein